MNSDLPLNELKPLPVGGLRNLLRHLDANHSLPKALPSGTGRLALHLTTRQDNNSGSTKGFVYFQNNKIYSITYEGFAPPIAIRLLTSELINEEICQYLNKFDPMHVGKEAIKNKYINAEELNEINRQMSLSSLTYLYGWHDALWRWEPDETFDGFQIPEISLHLLLSSADERIGQWDALRRNFPEATKPDAIPCPGPEWQKRSIIDPSPEMRRLSTLIEEGRCSVAKAAILCGFTRFEIADKLAKATTAGVITVMHPTTEAKESVLERSQFLNDYNTAKRDLDLARSNLASAELNFEEIEARIRASQVE